MTDLLANAELQVLSGTGHEANVEAPEKLADMLRKFYNRVAKTEIYGGLKNGEEK